MSEYCFCYENSENRNLFQLDCTHSFHELCLRKLLCHYWLESPRPRTVDTELRKVVDLPCPLCRTPVSPTKLRELQRECKIITVDMLVVEDPLREYFYIVTVRSNQSHLIHKKYLSKDLPVIATVSPDCVHKLLYADYIVTTDSPLTSFKMKVRSRQRHPESSAVEVLHEVRVVANELPSLSPDAAEEDCRKILEDCFCRNDLRTISCEAQDQAFETWKNTQITPPLPQAILPDVRPPASSAPVVPTPGPSRISVEPVRCVRCPQVRTFVEKAARERQMLRKRENNYKTRINASIAASVKQLNALHKNIDKWKNIRNNLYVQNSTETENRQNAYIRNEQVITQMTKIQRELDILKQNFS